MNIALWILQVVLTIVNALHGWLYVTWSPATEERMRKRSPKPLGLHPAFRTFIGVAELLAAVGLILPAATGILPRLTPLAAAGFAPIMAGAVVFHLRREETSRAISSAVICILAVFVASMRWQVVSL
jgi:uncharacterized membrane protein YphA (DoxX/SURF4 family)